MTLRTNLATRPFYNVRAVQAVLLLATIAVIALTAFNVYRLSTLAGAQSRLGAHAAEAETQAATLRAEATRIRTQIDQKELAAVSAAAREANAIIDRRAFSWTDLLTQLEATLPADVRITAIQPRFDRGASKIGLVAVARRAEDVADFIEALEKTGQFHNVVPFQQSVDDDGSINVALEGDYRQVAGAAAAESEASAPQSKPGAAP
jgi:Tfp pilus assembly protein PilN